MTTIIKDNFISKCIQQVWPGRTITWCNISISSLTCHSCVQTTPPKKKQQQQTNKPTTHTKKKTNKLSGWYSLYIKTFPHLGNRLRHCHHCSHYCCHTSIWHWYTGHHWDTETLIPVCTPFHLKASVDIFYCLTVTEQTGPTQSFTNKGMQHSWEF